MLNLLSRLHKKELFVYMQVSAVVHQEGGTSFPLTTAQLCLTLGLLFALGVINTGRASAHPDFGRTNA